MPAVLKENREPADPSAKAARKVEIRCTRTSNLERPSKLATYTSPDSTSAITHAAGTLKPCMSAPHTDAGGGMKGDHPDTILEAGDALMGTSSAMPGGLGEASRDGMGISPALPDRIGQAGNVDMVTSPVLPNSFGKAGGIRADALPALPTPDEAAKRHAPAEKSLGGIEPDADFGPQHQSPAEGTDVVPAVQPLRTKQTLGRKVLKRKAEVPALDAVGLKLLEAWDLFKERSHERLDFREIDVATTMKPEHAIGRAVRVYWPDEDDWFSGTIEDFSHETGQHKITYADGDTESICLVAGLERVRVLTPARNRFEPPTPENLHDMSQCLLGQSRNLQCRKGSEGRCRSLEAISLRLRRTAEEACQTPSEEPVSETDLLGNIVWAKTKGYASWPSLIVTKEDAAAKGLKGIRKTSVCLQAFGDFSWFKVTHGDITEFATGVHNGFHQKQKRPAFQRAIYEVLTYLQEGVLPEDMGLDYDDGIDTDAESNPLSEAALQDQQDGNIRIDDKLTVHCLGQVEFLHPAFHNEKHIWPRGYRATSLVKSTASKGELAEHLCEILVSPSGSGPLFRITCNRVTVESKVSPQQAWIKLHAGRKERLTGQEGLHAFGLRSKSVCQLIQHLPLAVRCERYSCWPEGDAPVVPGLTLAESLQRRRAEAEMQQLPDGIQAVSHSPLEGPRCDACSLEIEYEDNIMLQCDGPCRMFVHQACVGLQNRPRGSWLCQLCSLGCQHLPACTLCTTQGGLMIPTACGRWCHAACALWIPEAFLVAEVSGTTKVDISHVPKVRKHLLCSVCKQGHGACIQCAGSSNCFAAFHPLCARSIDLFMESQHDEHFLKDDSPAKAEKPLAGGRQGAGAADRRKRRKTEGRRPFVEGTALGDGTRLVYFCRKHSAGKLQAKRQLQALSQPLQEGWNRLNQEADEEQLLEESEAGCSRGRPYDHRLRRGLRAPEAISAALAKRNFVKAQPYQVSELPRLICTNQLQSHCFRACKTGPWKGFAQKISKQGVQTLSERYWQMRATENARVALGKSRIHGWGALSKVVHHRGDLVIEYSGELVRPSVADARERQLYDRLVGAGTYVFRMNENVCVDATAAGNLAHMLNHSCQPNCYSRTIEILNQAGDPEEHVVIVAKEEIPALQELTYDYRFSSAEILPCNCGAEKCCGLVNETSSADLGCLRVPLSQLRPLKLKS